MSLWRSRIPEITAMREGGATWAAVGEKYDVAEDTARKLYKRALKAENRVSLEEQVDMITVDLDENDPRIASILKKAEINFDEWEPVKCVANEWGFNPHTEQPYYQAKVWLRWIREGGLLREIAERCLATIREYSTSLPYTQLRHKSLAEPHLFELSIFDAHFGKLAWHQEVGGESYDLDIAEACFREAVDALLVRTGGFEIERNMIPIGQDLLHIDNLISATTLGTRQDTDTRYMKMFSRAHRCVSWMIRRTLEVTSRPVDVIIVPGNHDRLASFHIGAVLEAEFAGDPMVSVDNRPTVRKYYEYGTNLIGLTHGENIKVNDLPLLMADEQKEAWARTTHREWHLGHRHKKTQMKWVGTESFGYTSVRTLPSLSATDAWHYEQGYRAMRQSEAYLWHRETGYAGHFSHTAKGVE